MAALLVGGAIEGIHKIKGKRAAKRASRIETCPEYEEASPSSTNCIAPPAFSSTSHDAHHPDRPQDDTLYDTPAAAEKEALRHAETVANTSDTTVPQLDDDDDLPPYHAPPYERHQSDMLLETSRRAKPSHSRRTAGLFPRRAHTSSIAESSRAAAEAERSGRTPCRVGPDGRCACGKRERSPHAPLGETVKERRERKWKQMWSLDNPGFWGTFDRSYSVSMLR